MQALIESQKKCDLLQKELSEKEEVLAKMKMTMEASSMVKERRCDDE